MKLILIWVVFTFAIAFRARRIDRWLVLGYAALCFLNVVYAYLSF